MKNKIFSILLFFFYLVSATLVMGNDQCSSSFSQVFSNTTTSYSTSKSVNNGHPSDSYYFSVNWAGTLTVTLSGPDVDAGKVKFTGSQNPSSCPGTTGSLVTQTYTFTSAGDLNIKAYINGASSNQSYTLTAIFVPRAPIADYHLDECIWNGTAAEVKDSGPSVLHGKSVNGANTDTGKICKSGKFDGINDHVDLGNVLNPASSSWSISVWFKWDGRSGDNIIYNKENLYEARVSGGYFQYAWMPNWNWDGGTSFPVVANTWYHAVVTYDGTTQKVYRNGVKVYERAQTGAIGTNTNKLLIGARGSSSPNSFYNGNIDELHMFDMALNPTDIATLYSNEASGKDYDGTNRVCSNCISNISVIEGDIGTTNAVFTLSLGKPVTALTTVNYATADGTATVANNDYNATNGTVSFAAGEQTKTITVKVNGDLTFEPDETFKLLLSNATNGLLINSEAIGTIVNDDLHFAADYHLDECSWNGTLSEVKDSGPSVLHGKSVNGANTDTGKICKSGKFDGINDHVDLGNVLNPASSSWSISVWFKWDGRSGDNIIYNKENLYEARVSGGYFQYAWMPHWNWDGGTSFPVTVNTWYHAVITYDGTTQKVYKDGVKVYERAQTGAIGTNTNKLLIGARGSSSPNSFYNGNIDELHMFDMALTDQKIATLYNNEAAGKNYNGSTRTCNNCVIADYHLDECAWNGLSNEVLDSSQNNLHGTAVNNLNTVDGGKLCKAGNFNPVGTKEYITVPDNDLLDGTNKLTIIGWINPSTYTPLNGDNALGILSKRVSSTSQYAYGLFFGYPFGSCTKEKLVIDMDDANDRFCTNSSIPLNTWTHFSVVFDGTLPQTQRVKVYLNGVLDTTASETSTTIQNSTAPLRIGSLFESANSPKTFKGSIDEVKIFNSALSATQIQTIVGYEKQGLQYDGNSRTCTACIITPPNCTSLTYELYHPLSSIHKLQSRIAQQVFDLNVSIMCTSGSDPIPARQIKKIYAVTGACPAPTPGLPILWNSSADINNTTKTVTLSGLNSLKTYSNIKLMLETNASEYNCSTDNFAIRPSFYTISPPSSPIKAADFTLQILATNSGAGYNGTANIVTGLQAANQNCPVSNGFLKSSMGLTEPLAVTFLNDTNSSSLKATDVGAIYLNIKDTTWTAVDQPNDCINDSNTTITNGQGLFGCTIESNSSVVIIPNNFDINSTLANSSNGLFTYLSNDLNMSAQLAVNITAKNSEGNTTKNYDKGCYAKSTTLNFPHSVVPTPLSKIFYTESFSGINGNVSTSNDINLSLPKTIFTQGTVPLSLAINFDRNSSKPLNPFTFNVTNSSIFDTDNVSGTNIPTGTANFIYGRARAYDIKTDQSSAPNPIELEVYSTTSNGYVTAMPQNILHWYRNLNHNTVNEGSVLGGGFTIGISDNTQVNASAIPINGIHPITVTSTTDQTIHIDVPTWLWYSPIYNYNYTTNCLQHPCFNYQTFGTSSAIGVQSGTFQGSDFSLTPAKTIIKKGVKVFR